MRSRVAWAVAFAFLPSVLAAEGQPSPKLDWIAGPADVDLGDVAQLEIPNGYVFLDAKGARALLEASGNVPDGTELGLVSGAGEDENWFVVFEFDEIGYVKDDEKDEIDAKAILDGVRRGTEEANKVRQERGISALHVVGWHQEPFYDPQTNNLSWALLAKDDSGDQVVNFNVRLLGRRGVMSATLVDDPSRLAATRPHLDRVVASFTYKSGQKYAEFRSGDKVAQYGLAALVAGGVGAAAAKTGLLGALAKLVAKGGKAIVLLAVAALAGLKKLLGVFRNDTPAA
jgi:uncharacterized membrane-anchored protein